MLAQNWSLKVEYNFLDLGTKDVALGGVGCIVASYGRTISIDQNIHLVKAGINFHFGEPPGSLWY